MRGRHGEKGLSYELAVCSTELRKSVLHGVLQPGMRDVKNTDVFFTLLLVYKTFIYVENDVKIINILKLKI